MTFRWSLAHFLFPVKSVNAVVGFDHVPDTSRVQTYASQLASYLLVWVYTSHQPSAWLPSWVVRDAGQTDGLVVHVGTYRLVHTCVADLGGYGLPPLSAWHQRFALVGLAGTALSGSQWKRASSFRMKLIDEQRVQFSACEWQDPDWETRLAEIRRTIWWWRVRTVC